MSNDAFDEFLDAIEANRAYYLSCPEGHGSLPPQRICPECHSQDLSQELLPTTGELKTYSVVSVPAPRFSDDKPYITAIANFGPVNITGQLQDIDPENVEVGQSVTLSLKTTDNQRIIVFKLE